MAEAIRLLHKLLRKVKQIIMNQTELAQALADLGTQLNKALDEIRTAIENGGNVTPEVEAALNNAKAVAQALDDLNPDQPAGQTGHPKKAVTLPPSEFGKAREQEIADSQPEAIAVRREEEAKHQKK